MAKPKAPKGCYWRGSVLWGQVQVKGQKIQWSLDTDDPRVARERRKAGKREAVAAKYGDAPHLIDDVIRAWAPNVSADKSTSTVRRYMVSLGQIAGHLDGRCLTDVTPRLIGDIIAERQRTASNATVRRDLSALSSVMAYAAGRGWIDCNPVPQRMALVSERRDPIILPRDEDIALVLACAAESKAVGCWSQLIRAAWVTGARLSELVNTERSQVDHGRRELTLIGKGNKLRVIDLVPFGAYDLIAGLPAYVGSRFLFWHDRGEPYRNASSNFANNLVGTARRSCATFRPFRFHDLRHRHAVDWLQSGRSIYTLQHRLGHSSIKVTEGYLRYMTGEAEQQTKFGRMA